MVKLLKKTKTIYVSQNGLDSVYKARATHRGSVILVIPLQPLHAKFQIIPSYRIQCLSTVSNAAPPADPEGSVSVCACVCLCLQLYV